jgi:hypothetical protein
MAAGTERFGSFVVWIAIGSWQMSGGKISGEKKRVKPTFLEECES